MRGGVDCDPTLRVASRGIHAPGHRVNHSSEGAQIPLVSDVGGQMPGTCRQRSVLPINVDVSRIRPRATRFQANRPVVHSMTGNSGSGFGKGTAMHAVQSDHDHAQPTGRDELTTKNPGRSNQKRPTEPLTLPFCPDFVNKRSHASHSRAPGDVPMALT